MEARESSSGYSTLPTASLDVRRNLALAQDPMPDAWSWSHDDAPGLYRTICNKVAVSAMIHGGSEICELELGSQVRVVELATCNGRLKGLLEEAHGVPSGWISLLDLSSDRRWAMRVVLSEVPMSLTEGDARTLRGQLYGLIQQVAMASPSSSSGTCGVHGRQAQEVVQPRVRSEQGKQQACTTCVPQCWPAGMRSPLEPQHEALKSTVDVDRIVVGSDGRVQTLQSSDFASSREALPLGGLDARPELADLIHALGRPPNGRITMYTI
mmetsp:Transcript_5992/g.13213  ORF Transcript_5992/g.13213 Transcript_5992/m.13213 type:complete len:268 (-) Transcript_5992:75-878(-)